MGDLLQERQAKEQEEVRKRNLAKQIEADKAKESKSASVERLAPALRYGL